MDEDGQEVTRCDVTATSLRCRYDITVMSLSVIKVGMHALLEAVRQFCSRCVCARARVHACVHVSMLRKYSSTCHERTPSGPGKTVRSLQVAADQR